jgi:type I restriction enzyme S subunit
MERKLLSEIAWFQEGPGVRNTQYTTSGVKLLNVSNLVDGELDISNSSRFISREEANGKYHHFLCDAGDLIIASSGITKESLSQKNGFVSESDLPLCMNTSTIRFKPLDGKIDLRFLYLFFQSSDFNEQISKLMTGSAQLNFGPSHLQKITVPYYPISRQAKIADEMFKIKQEISSLKNEKKASDDLIKSRFVEMFGECDMNKPKTEWKRLDEVTTVVAGTTPKTNVPEYWDGEIKWIAPAEIPNDAFLIDDTQKHITEAGRKSCSLTLMPSGTVLFSTRAPIGKVAISNSEMCCNQGFKNFICSSQINNVFLYQLLKMNVDWLQNQGTGTTFKEISKSSISSFLVPIPNVEKQKEFSVFLIKVNKLKLDIQKLIWLMSFWP